jgi:hypothetical protein
MRRFVVFALLAALPAPVLLSPTLASAAVSTYSYQITGGSADIYSSLDDISTWPITGGKFTVQFPTSVCSACTDVRLLSLSVQGAAGTLVASPNLLARLNAAATGAHNTPANRRAAAWSNDHSLGNTGVVFGDHAPEFGGPHLTVHHVGPFTQYTQYGGSYPAFPWTIHYLTAQEVAVPEPSAGAMLATGGVMLGAYALRRARRSLG